MVSQIIILLGKPLALLRHVSQAHWPFQQKGLHQGPWVSDGWAESLAYSVNSHSSGSDRVLGAAGKRTQIVSPQGRIQVRQT